MNKVLRLITVLIAVALLSIGASWLVAPAWIAAQLGMPLLDGMGLSSQVGDLGAFFTASGVMVVMGLITQRRQWFQAAALLMAGAALFRTMAWLFLDASLAVMAIGVEIITTVILLLAAARLSRK